MIVSIVTDASAGPGTTHALGKLEETLAEKSIPLERPVSLRAAGTSVVVAGLAGGRGQAARLARRVKLTVPRVPEALGIRRVRVGGQDVLLVCGTDDRGLMYALLDVADRIGWADGPDPFAHVRDTVEQPYVIERAVSKYTMHRACLESFFYDEAYWARYLDMLAGNRFNTFALLFAYESSGYMAPPYPYFFDVKGFPKVRVVGLSKPEQKRNLAALNRLIAMTYERGLNFTLGIWDHIYRGRVQGSAPTDRPVEGLVWGVTKRNLLRYTTAALTKLLQEVSGINTLQFRMHGESGLKREEFGTFWGAVYDLMKTHGKGIRFDARAKGFPHELIDEAIRRGIDIRMCTKYWAEQMGLPFHPTHIPRANQHDRRHSYADMLRYPQTYKMHWRLWNGGTQRILLWGDPDYVRRFAESTHLYDGEGFEVNEPLATKMQNHPHKAAPFELLTDKHRYYDWEFERYWHFFQVFGRVGYDPAVPTEIWQRQFARRFGQAGRFLEKGLHRASQILPRITASQMAHFPTTRGWPERQRGGDVPTYARIRPSDIQQFLSMAEAAELQLAGSESPKIHPAANSRWLARAAEDVLAMVAGAQKATGRRKSREFVSTVTDLKILGYLALYHSRRIHAGICWRLFELSRDANALDDATAHEARAIEAWEKLVVAAGDVYTDDLAMGGRVFNMAGHWRDELPAFRKNLAKLERQRRKLQSTVKRSPRIAHVPVRRAEPGKALVIRATVRTAGRPATVRVGYGHEKAGYKYVKMNPATAPCYRATIPGRVVRKGLTYFIEAVDEGGSRRMFPTVPVTVTRDSKPPAVVHEPIAVAPVGRPLKISATVRDASGVRWVRLRYRNVTQFEDYKTLDMQPVGDGRYEVTVRGEELTAQWDFMYLIEAMDNAGNGRIWPDIETETPYVIVHLKRGRSRKK